MDEKFDWTLLFSKRYVSFVHLIFWCLVFWMLIVFEEYPEWCKGAEGTCISFQTTLQTLIPCYSQVFIVWPFFVRRNYGAGVLAYILQIVILALILPHLLNIAGLLFRQVIYINNWVDWTSEHMIFNIISFTVIATFFKLALDKLILDKQLKDAELRHLKAQLNPHFLFNTLNNLYGLSIAHSDRLPEMMLKLSDLLRYSLYGTNRPYVPLKNELEYIGNYIELEQLRLDEKTDIKFTVEGHLSDQKISPLMLITFIENAFKHYSTERGKRGFVWVWFHISRDTLKMKVENSVDSTMLRDNMKTKQEAGIGLKNVRQRLELLYLKKYRLIESFEDNVYKVDLHLNLNRI